MGDLYWPPSLSGDTGKVLVTPECFRPNSIIQKLFEEVPYNPKHSPADIEFLCGLVYDDEMGGPDYKFSDKTLLEKPLHGIQVLPTEASALYSGERHQMQIFAEAKVNERIPGMTWEAFKKLDPMQTEMVFEIARVIGEAVERGVATAAAKLSNELNGLSGSG